MKRFYCTICKRIKRVQKYPTVISDTIQPNPGNRIGVCNHHPRQLVSDSLKAHKRGVA